MSHTTCTLRAGRITEMRSFRQKMKNENALIIKIKEKEQQINAPIAS